MFTLRTDHFPYVYAFAWGDLTLDDVQRIKSEYAAVHRRQEPFCSIVDVRGARRPNALIRKEIADLAKHFAPVSKELVLLSAVVVQDRLLAGALTAIRWLTGQDLNAEYVVSATDATDAARRVLLKNGNMQRTASAEQLARALDAAHLKDTRALDLLRREGAGLSTATRDARTP